MGVSPRGSGYIFGADISKKFINTKNVMIINRAHQIVMKGFNWSHENIVCTLFSAPNYCYRCGNQAGIMDINENFKHNIQQIDSNPIKRGKLDLSKRAPDYFLYNNIYNAINDNDYNIKNIVRCLINI